MQRLFLVLVLLLKACFAAKALDEYLVKDWRTMADHPKMAQLVKIGLVQPEHLKTVFQPLISSSLELFHLPLMSLKLTQN